MITIRPARAEDQAFVASTLSGQLARGDHREANVITDRVLDAPTTHILIAIDPAKQGRIVGWLAYAPVPRVRAVIFIYVRKEDRLQGIAKQLIAAAWPKSTGAYVHGGLRGGSTRALLKRFPATEVSLDELL